ncbi:hypothetical protein EON65_28890 [archaeon]|nr:MAG: hypothetical protein EON65_28890 [archaeon]
MQSKRADLRDLDKEILLAQRELIPLTTGLIAEVKRRRAQVWMCMFHSMCVRRVCPFQYTHTIEAL